MSARSANKAASADFLDLNGREVAAFASQVTNLGFAHFTDLLIAMFKSGSWRTFQDGLGTYEFLPGEFDYFLTPQGVSRDDVINGVRDIATKAQLEAAIDERRTGEQGYRRHITEVRRTNPQRQTWPADPAVRLPRIRGKIPGQRYPVRRGRVIEWHWAAAFHDGRTLVVRPR